MSMFDCIIPLFKENFIHVFLIYLHLTHQYVSYELFDVQEVFLTILCANEMGSYFMPKK